MRSPRPLVLASLAALALGVPPEASAQAGRDLSTILRNLPRPTFPRDTQSNKAAFEQRAPKIDPALLQLADEARTKGIGSLDVSAKDLGVPVSNQMVLVKLHVDGERNVDAVERAVEDLGGEIQSTFENLVFAEVPASAIERLGRIDPLYFAGPQGEFRINQRGGNASQVLSDGVAASKIEHLHRAGITGKGVKIGILDFGFRGLSQLVAAGEIQRPVAVKGFGGDSVENVEEAHGSACAEIVHDMAPDAELYLAMVGSGNGSASDGAIVAAAQWLGEQGVHIVSFSGGGHHGPQDGTAALDAVVEKLVRERNVLWVNAAGNEGADHWGGVVRDSNRDEVLEIDGQGAWGIAVQAADPRNPAIAVSVYWDDWGSNPDLPSATQDVDAYLFAVSPSGRELQVVAKSERRQGGRGEPFEFIGFRVPPNQAEQVFAVVLRATRVTRPLRVHVFARSAMHMAPKTPEGSVGIPATARQALSVGAVDVRNAKLEDFSSQGPTDDGRLKPELSASDNTVSISYRSQQNPEGRFPGTSAACPHVSGFAALIRQMNASASPDQLKRLVVANVRDMGRPGPDNAYGAGHIDGSRLDPAGGNAGRDLDRSEIVGNVPEAFGSDDLSQGNFEELWRIARREREREDLKVVTGSPTYRVGDGLKVGIRSDRTCSYMLVHRDSRGQFTVLAPERGSGRLTAGARYALPENETWDVTEPTGQEGLMVVCTGDRINLADWIDNPTSGRVWFATATYVVNR